MKRDEPGGTRLLLAACLAAFASFLVDRALIPFLPAVAADLGVGVAQVGQVPAVASAAAAILGLPLGPLADRFTRRMLASGVAAAGISALVSGLAPALVALAAAGLLVALGRAVVPPAALALVGTRLPERSRGRAISYVVAAFSGVAIVGLPALTALAEALGGWRPAFLVLGLFALAVAGLVIALVPPDAPAPGERVSLRAAYAPLLRDRSTVGVMAAALLRNASLWTFATYWGAFLIQRHGLGLAEVGLGYTVTGLGHVAGGLLVGRAVRPGRPPRALLGLATLGAGGALAAALLSPFGAGAALALGAVGLLMIGAGDVANAALLTAESPGGRASAMTLNQTGLNVGTAAGGAVGGLLLASGGYGLLGAGTLLLALLAAVPLWLWRPPAPRRP